jgi:hypothetical protein
MERKIIMAVYGMVLEKKEIKSMTDEEKEHKRLYIQDVVYLLEKMSYDGAIFLCDTVFEHSNYFCDEAF